MHAFENKRPRGRPKGSRNRVGLRAKEALEQTFASLGGVDGLAAWAKDHPTDFYRLYAKLLPLEVRADVQHQGAVTFIVDTGIPRSPDMPHAEAA